MKSTRPYASVLSRVLRRCLLVTALVMGVSSQALADDQDDYLRGYVDALLDSRYPGLGLRVQAIAPEAAVTLTSRTCLGPWQKRDVTQLLVKSERVKTVFWSLPPGCGAEESAPESGQPATEASPPVPVDIHALPETELFAPLIADPRQPRFSVSYQRYRGAAREFAAASVAVGEYFGLASGLFGEYGSSQIGIQGAVFALFNLDAPSNDLINADYWIGLPISYRRGPWSYLVRLYHQSSHLGDEFILGNPGVDRVNLSYEDLEALVSYEWERLRVYGGGGYLVHSEPDLAPKHVHAGVEYVQPRATGKLDFIAAADLRASEELGWGSSRSYQAGFEFKGGGPRRVRLMLEHFRGHSPNGQFYREPLRYTGLGFYFGF